MATELTIAKNEGDRKLFTGSVTKDRARDLLSGMGAGFVGKVCFSMHCFFKSEIAFSCGFTQVH